MIAEIRKWFKIRKDSPVGMVGMPTWSVENVLRKKQTS